MRKKLELTHYPQYKTGIKKIDLEKRLGQSFKKQKKKKTIKNEKEEKGKQIDQHVFFSSKFEFGHGYLFILNFDPIFLECLIS